MFFLFPIRIDLFFSPDSNTCFLHSGFLSLIHFPLLLTLQWGLSACGVFGYALDLCDSDEAFQILFGMGHFLGTIGGTWWWWIMTVSWNRYLCELF
jgi:hypothetical protein